MNTRVDKCDQEDKCPDVQKLVDFINTKYKLSITQEHITQEHITQEHIPVNFYKKVITKIEKYYNQDNRKESFDVFKKDNYNEITNYNNNIENKFKLILKNYNMTEEAFKLKNYINMTEDEFKLKFKNYNNMTEDEFKQEIKDIDYEIEQNYKQINVWKSIYDQGSNLIKEKQTANDNKIIHEIKDHFLNSKKEILDKFLKSFETYYMEKTGVHNIKDLMKEYADLSNLVGGFRKMKSKKSVKHNKAKLSTKKRKTRRYRRR